MPDTIEQITNDLSEYLDGYCEHCIFHALGIQLTTTIINISETRQDAEENIAEITNMIRTIILRDWERLKAQEESASAVRH